MKKTTEIITGIVLITVTVVLLAFFIIGMNYNRIRNNAPNSEYEIIERCGNLSVIPTGECLNKQIKSFFYYNKTEGVSPGTFQDIRTYGGICGDWARLYADLSLQLGYSGNKVPVGNHAFATISDRRNNGCILDMKDIICSENLSGLIEEYSKEFPAKDIDMEQRRKDLREYVDGGVMN